MAQFSDENHKELLAYTRKTLKDQDRCLAIEKLIASDPLWKANSESLKHLDLEKNSAGYDGERIQVYIQQLREHTSDTPTKTIFRKAAEAFRDRADANKRKENLEYFKSILAKNSALTRDSGEPSTACHRYLMRVMRCLNTEAVKENVIPVTEKLTREWLLEDYYMSALEEATDLLLGVKQERYYGERATRAESVPSLTSIPIKSMVVSVDPYQGPISETMRASISINPTLSAGFWESVYRDAQDNQPLVEEAKKRIEKFCKDHGYEHELELPRRISDPTIFRVSRYHADPGDVPDQLAFWVDVEKELKEAFADLTKAHPYETPKDKALYESDELERLTNSTNGKRNFSAAISAMVDEHLHHFELDTDSKIALMQELLPYTDKAIKEGQEPGKLERMLQKYCPTQPLAFRPPSSPEELEALFTGSPLAKNPARENDYRHHDKSEFAEHFSALVTHCRNYREQKTQLRGKH